jgi:tetratricopeptide (TPR) repeat protein
MHRFFHIVYKEISLRRIVYFISANLAALFSMSIAFYIMTVKYPMMSKFLVFGTTLVSGLIPLVCIFHYVFFDTKAKGLLNEISPTEYIYILGENLVGKTALVRNIARPLIQSLGSDVLYLDLIRAWTLALKRGDRDTAAEVITLIHKMGQLAVKNGNKEIAGRAEASLFLIRNTAFEQGLQEFGDIHAQKTNRFDQFRKITTELEIKPWELMFYIILVIKSRQPINAEDIIQYFLEHFSEVSGVSRANIHRYLQRLTMKGYIEYNKTVYREEDLFQLSEKGEEIFVMAKDEATQELRTSEEWDASLKRVYQDQDRSRRQDTEALFQSLKTVPADLDKEVMAWILYKRADIFELKGNLEDAEKDYLHMDSLCEETGDKRGRAYALKGLGNVAFKQGKYVVAEGYYNKCHRIAKYAEDIMLLADVLNDLGACLYMNDEIDEALQTFENVLNLVANDRSRRASTLYNCGLCHARKENFIKARELWEESLKIHQSIGYIPGIREVEHNLKEVNRKEKQRYMEKIFRTAKLFGTSEEIRKAYFELVRFEMNNFKISGNLKDSDEFELRDPIVR